MPVTTRAISPSFKFLFIVLHLEAPPEGEQYSCQIEWAVNKAI